MLVCVCVCVSSVPSCVFGLSGKFEALLSALQHSADALGVSTLGLGVTTLEEVFARVGHDSGAGAGAGTSAVTGTTSGDENDDGLGGASDVEGSGGRHQQRVGASYAAPSHPAMTAGAGAGGTGASAGARAGARTRAGSGGNSDEVELEDPVLGGGAGERVGDNRHHHYNHDRHSGEGGRAQAFTDEDDDVASAAALLDAAASALQKVSFCSHVQAMLAKRSQYYMRDGRAWCCQVFLPVGILLFGLMLIKFIPSFNQPLLVLDASPYNPVRCVCVSARSVCVVSLCARSVCMCLGSEAGWPGG